MISLFSKPRWNSTNGLLSNRRFRPTVLSNINYGQSNRDNSTTKILALKGIGNGFSNVLYFQRRGGQWELYKFEDTGI
jgi:hypothetical protein